MRAFLAAIAAAFIIVSANTAAAGRPTQPQEQTSAIPLPFWLADPVVPRRKAVKSRGARRGLHRARRAVHSDRRRGRVHHPGKARPVPVGWPLAMLGSGRVAVARQYLGMNARQLGLPRRLWCADFANFIEYQVGARGTGSRMAASFASYGARLSGPAIGAYAVLSRGRRGGHVGIVSGIDANGNPIILSGNHNGRVAEAVYARRRVYAFVQP
jgi:uncharacterized protein (TIGR02594 family)